MCGMNGPFWVVHDVIIIVVVTLLAFFEIVVFLYGCVYCIYKYNKGFKNITMLCIPIIYINFHSIYPKNINLHHLNMEYSVHKLSTQRYIECL